MNKSMTESDLLFIIMYAIIGALGGIVSAQNDISFIAAMVVVILINLSIIFLRVNFTKEPKK